MVDEEISFFADLYGHYKRSVLWLDGGLAKQPNFYMELMKEFAFLEATIKTHEDR